MAESAIKYIPAEILVSATDSYAQTWTLERYGKMYVLSVVKFDQEISPPSGSLSCPLTVRSDWLPSQQHVAMSVSQGGNIWNLSAQPTGIGGWVYATDATQRFAQLVWVK